MTKETRAKFNKAATPVFRTTSTVSLIAILAQGYFDQTKQQIANDVMITKVTIQHMSKQQDERDAATSIRIGRLEKNYDEHVIDFREHCTKEDSRIAALWKRGKRNSENSVDTLNSNQN